MSVQVSYKKQFLFGFLLMLFILSVVEIVMRIYDYYIPNCRFIESDVSDGMNFDLKRNICNDNAKLTWTNNPLHLTPNQHFQTININSESFRGTELQKNPDYRIFVIGGSTTFGVGATSDHNTIPGYLQQLVSKDFGKYNIEVINAGIPKAYSFTEKNLIKDKLLSYNPDLLIIYDGWNDLQHDYDHYEDSGDYKLMDQIIRSIHRSDIVTPNVILKLYFNYKHDTVDIMPFNSYKIEQKTSLWKDAWINVCSLQEKYDFKTMIVLQPIVGTGNKSLSVEEQNYFIHYDSEQKNTYYQLYANKLNELNSICTITFDLRDGFDSNSETIFYDAGHVGDKGNQIIAKKIYDLISPIVQSDIQKK